MGTIPRQLLTLNGTWHIAKDADNVGKREAWHTAGPVADAKETHVPSVLEETFHDYDGVVWYWRRFDLPALDPGRRALLHFRAADWIENMPVMLSYSRLKTPLAKGRFSLPSAKTCL